jgi:TctA family transporter
VLCLFDTNRAVLITKVGSNRLLTTLTASSLDFVAIGTKEDSNLENTRDGLDLVGESRNLPFTILAVALFAVLEVLLGEKRLEGSVDDVETLVCVDRASLCKDVLAEFWFNGTDNLQLAHDGSVSNWCDLDGY